MLGISLPMREVFQRILEAASEDIAVLITGETGTGKDMVAAAIHRTTNGRPLHPVNTGAIPISIGRKRALLATKGRLHRRSGSC